MCRNNDMNNMRHGCGCEGGRHEGRGHCGHGHDHMHHRMSEEELASLGTDARLGMTMHRLNCMSRFIMGERMGQLRVLELLARWGDMTQRELTEMLGIRPGSASELIGKLERAGLIARTESDADRRTAVVHLTDSGLEQLESRDKERPELFSALSADEKEQLLALLEKLRADWRERFPHEHPCRGGHGKHGCCESKDE